MAIWAFDGSFEGLLSLFAELFRRNEIPDDLVVQGEGAQGTLFAPVFVPTHESAAEAFARAVRRRLGDRTFDAVMLAFLAERPRMALALWRYLDFGRREGPAFFLQVGDPRVRPVQLARRAVLGETHRLLGLVRFELLREMLYASLEPRHNVLELLGPPFLRRLPGERWMLHDVARRKAVYFDGEALQAAEAPGEALVCAPEGEENYKRLWQRYFAAIAVEHRRNIRRQKHFIPERYWKFLPEKALMPDDPGATPA